MMLSLTGVFSLSHNDIVVLVFGFVYCLDVGVFVQSQFVLPYSDGLQNGR